MSPVQPALDWLLGFSDPKRGVGWNRASRGGLEANLRRTRVLLDLAGAPDRRMLVVLVAGTKGKGSTAAMLASVLAASGVRAGLSTKPHLQAFRERVRVDGVAIDDTAFGARVAELRPLIAELEERLPAAGAPTTFELTLALALRHYVKERCDVAVIEVGLGGRFDATNATDPHVSVITAISHDHTKELGSRLRDIAAEKAGIVRPGRVAVVEPQPAEARAAIRTACERAGAELREVRALPERVALSLRGTHQRSNAAAALEAARALAQHGVAFRADAAEGALKRLMWPGRFEVIPGEPTIVLDAAHNDGSARALAQTLRASFPKRRVRFVLGVMEDTDARAVIAPLLPLASAVEVTRAPGPRGLDPKRLARLVRSRRTRIHEEPAAALAAAQADARHGEVVCVTGSFALVGRARETLGLSIPERLWDDA